MTDRLACTAPPADVAAFLICDNLRPSADELLPFPSLRPHNEDMARLGRRWRVAKWAGMSATLLTGILWLLSVSNLVSFFRADDPVSVGLADGAFYVVLWPVWRPATKPSGIYCPSRKSMGIAVYLIARLSPTSKLRPTFLPERCLVIPIWNLVLLAGTPTAYLCYRDRRRIPIQCCQACGYDLTGNTSGICPECGNKI